MHFWKLINQARNKIHSADKGSLEPIFKSIYENLSTLNNEERKKKIEFFKLFAKTYNFENLIIDDKHFEEIRNKPTPVSMYEDLDSHVTTVSEGISLVTCCMNRNENLLKAIKSWILCDWIDEILIVDWSSTSPVANFLAENNIYDPRIKVVRVENQPRWILSYAFNVGFRSSSFNKILKTDADIIIKPDFLERNSLGDNIFIAGDWRKAAQGQEHINGFFFVNRSHLMDIKGFNEYLTTYGWDDDDIYSRMESIGLTRTLVNLNTIYHIPHGDELRISSDTSGGDPLTELHGTTRFKIRTNRFIANVMPTWTKDRVFLPFKITEQRKNYLKLEQHGESIHYVPKHVRDDAEYYTEVELTSWQAGLRAFDLDRVNLRKLLSRKPLSLINRLDIEVAIHNPLPEFKLTDNYFVIKVKPEIAHKRPELLTSIIDAAYKIALGSGYGLILAAETRPQVAPYLSEEKNIGFVPSWLNLDNPAEVDMGIDKELISRSSKENIQLTLELAALPSILSFLERRTIPQILIKRDKLFLDAQHGLGNRLRAIASGAAIAEATNRELVIVWQPDHHCECRFEDLFEYKGAVVEQSFVSEANQKGLAVFNYMEIEPGAEKDAPIICRDNVDIYARSAYTLKSDLTNWDAENKFLRGLTPSSRVLDLVKPFNLTNHLGAHIRMEAGKGLDHNTYDSVENWTQEGHDLLHYWREKSHFSHFIKRIDQLFSEDGNQKLFLATDLPETYKTFQDYYGDKLVYLKRTAYDRSREQIIYALADAMLLSKCNRLLGSTWSSFSELAMRLSTSYSKIEMSGTDF